MPTYDYRCTNCTHTFELRQSFESEPVTTCPKCDHKARRLFHTPVIIYKGSGFYTTDYKNNQASSPDYSKDGASTTGEDSSKAEPAAASKDKAAEKSTPKESNG